MYTVQSGGSIKDPMAAPGPYENQEPPTLVFDVGGQICPFGSHGFVPW